MTYMKSLRERFDERLTPGNPDECWEWTGYRDGGGYGQLRTGPAGAPRIKAHRAAWILAHGEIVDGMQVCHACDNPPCCNPAHLWLGTPSDNMQDKVRKGRCGAVGLANRRLDAAAIRAGYVRNFEKAVHPHGGWSWRSNARELAEEFGTTEQYIGAVVRGQKRKRG